MLKPITLDYIFTNIEFETFVGDVLETSSNSVLC